MRIPFFLYFNTSLLIVVEECNRGMEKSIFLSKRKMRENSKKTRKNTKKKPGGKTNSMGLPKPRENFLIAFFLLKEKMLIEKKKS